jgi:hypothetical protein
LALIFRGLKPGHGRRQTLHKESQSRKFAELILSLSSSLCTASADNFMQIYEFAESWRSPTTTIIDDHINTAVCWLKKVFARTKYIDLCHHRNTGVKSATTMHILWASLLSFASGFVIISIGPC